MGVWKVMRGAMVTYSAGRQAQGRLVVTEERRGGVESSRIELAYLEVELC